MGEYGSLAGMRVIVTGASRGIGRAVAIACARHGATVGVNYHLSGRFIVRADYSIYTAYVSDANSAEYRAATLGVSVFF